MPSSISKTATSESGTWRMDAPVGYSRLQAISTSDGDTSYLVTFSQADPPSAEEALTFTWNTATELPDDAYIVGYGLGVHARGHDFPTDTPVSIPNAMVLSIDGFAGFSTVSVQSLYQFSGRTVTLASPQLNPKTIVSIVGRLKRGFGFENTTRELRVTYATALLHYTRPPQAPTITSPTNGATISTGMPTIEGTHNSPTNDGLGQVQMEVRRVSNNALMWDTTFSASGFTWSRTYAGQSLTPGVTYKIRARTRNANLDVWGPWSDWVEFTPQFNVPPIVSLISPSEGANVSTLTLTFSWSYSDPNGDPQGHYQIQVRPQNGAVSWDTGQVAGSQNSRVYDGPALVEGQPMEVRVRAWDNQGAASEYTPWRLFTYAPSKPSPPTLTIEPLVDSLTFTIAGSYNQGTGDEEAGYYYELRQSGITIYQSGFVTGNIATGQAYGTVNPLGNPSTPPSLSWGTDYQIRAKSRDIAGRESDWSGWLPIRTQSPPTTPTNLSPRDSITGNTTPRLSWQHNDPDGDPQTAVEIELREAATDAVVGDYGPLYLEQPEQFHDLLETLTDNPATQYKWRVRTMATLGAGWSAWSDWATFTVATVPVLSVLSPTPSQEVTAPGLVVAWEITGGSGVQQSYRVRVYAEDQATVIHDSGVTGGTVAQYAIPLGVLRNEGAYYVRVSVTDTLGLIADSGLISITTSWTPPETVTSLFAQAIGDQADGTSMELGALPNIYLTWDESPEPVSSFLRYVIYRRIVGEDAWRQLAIISDRSLTSYNDYTVASDTLYEYIVIVVADVAGEEVESEPPVPAQAQVTIRSAFVHAHGEESVYAEFRAETQSVDMGQDIAYVQPRRSRAPVAHVGGQLAGVFELNVTDTWAPDLWRRVRALQEVQARGRVLMLRQHRDLCAYVVLESAQRSDQTTLMGLQLRFREVEAPGD